MVVITSRLLEIALYGHYVRRSWEEGERQICTFALTGNTLLGCDGKTRFCSGMANKKQEIEFLEDSSKNEKDKSVRTNFYDVESILSTREKLNVNWPLFIKPARSAFEQNILIENINERICITVLKDICYNEELLACFRNQDQDSEDNATFIFSTLANSTTPTFINKSLECLSDKNGFQCQHCGKMFTYEYYLKKHLKYTRCVDQGNRKFRCNICPRSFDKKDRLRIHILHVHDKHRPHTCYICGKSFSQSSSLNKHTRVHSGDRPYKCLYCNKAFTASSILRTHIRQHSGEKPFKCKHCGKSFASHAAHDSHMRRAHAEQKVNLCNICGKTFMLESVLKIHLTMHREERSELDTA